MTNEEITEVVRLHAVFKSMRSRCYLKTSHAYKDYGGRGIYIADEWLYDFPAFVQWNMAHGSRKGLQIDRIDNDGPYSPDNCRLVTSKENNNNRRNNKLITAWGETKTSAEWSRDPRVSVKQGVINSRICELGWTDMEKVLTAPLDPVRKSLNPTHCKNGGHEYTDANTYYSKAQPHIKKCRKCHSQRQNARYYKAKGLDK